MEMPLEKIAAVLDAWDADTAAAQRLIQTHVSAVEKQLAAVQLAARLLREELLQDNEYPKILEMWNAVGRYVHEQNLESNWDADMTTYEVWHEDMTMTISWPGRAFTPTETEPHGELN